MLKYIILVTIIIVCIGLLVDKLLILAENKYNGTDTLDCRTWQESSLRYAITILSYFGLVYVYFRWQHPALLNQYMTQLNTL